MNFHNLFKVAELRRIAPDGTAATTWLKAAGTTDFNSAIVDTRGYKGVAWIVGVGLITTGGTVAVKVQQGEDSGLSDAADLTGTNQVTTADGDAGKCIVIDQYRPKKRYQRLAFDRSTANVVIDFVICVLYHADHANPISQGTTVFGAEFFNAVGEGTA